MFRRFLVAVPIAVMAIGGTTACASKKYVRTSVGEVNEKVDSLGRSVEETQERTRRNEAKINDVEKSAQEANQAAQTAQNSANQAGNRASEAMTAASTANSRAEAVEKASRKLVYEVVLSEDQGNFKFAKTDLPDEAKARLDEVISQLKADPKGAYFEIEGHTDNVGSKEYNEKLGLERAEAVKKYLYEHHQIPLFRMNVISYGEDKPVTPNKTKDDRAKNRRVVIRILA